MKDHTELFVYKASYDLLLSIFQITKNFGVRPGGTIRP
jgi:hypothetical protein